MQVASDMVIALSMLVPMVLFHALWIALMMWIDPIGRQMPSRDHPQHFTAKLPELPADPDEAIIDLLHHSQTLSAIELYAQVHDSSFAEAQVKVLKIEATLQN